MTPSAPPLLIRRARAALPGGCSTPAISVRIEDGRIVEIGDALDPRGETTIEAGERWLLPGLIDLQINDGEWLARGPATAEEHAGRIRKVIAHQVMLGVTGFQLATLAAPIEEVIAYLEGMATVRQGQEPLDAAFLGGLVEGTFMNPEHHGAHNPRWVLPPDRATLDRLIDTGGLRAINLAPETSVDAIELIRYARERGVVVACGHARPHAERLREAVEAGLSYVIHLGNGPTGSSLKEFHGGGMLEESLRNDDLSVTIIVDGHHVHPQLVRDWIARKQVPRVVGVSDAGFALGPPDGGFEVFGIRGGVSSGGDYLYVVRDDEADPRRGLTSDAVALFGSAIHQRTVFENVLNLLSLEMKGVYHRLHEAQPLDEAVFDAVSVTSTNPARLLGLDDRGRIAEGCRADLLLARIEGDPGGYRLEIDSIIVEGRVVKGGG